MIWVFYSNDPLADDLGGGAEHFRGIYRALERSGLPFHLVAAQLQDRRADRRVTYISKGSHFLRWWLALWLWTWRNRKHFAARDVCHFHRNYAAWPKRLLAPGRGRIVVTYHNCTGRVLEGVLGPLARPLRFLMRLAERSMARAADAIICVSERDRLDLRDTVAHEPFERALVIPASLDAGLFRRERPAPPSPELAFKILFLGRLSHQKNVPLALRVIESLAKDDGSWTLTVAGDGEDRDTVAGLVARSPARGHIRLAGAIPHFNVPALLAEHGIVLVTSRYEASPTVVKEALLAMRPVVTTDVGDVRRWLDEGRTGFIRKADAADLAEGARAASGLVRQRLYKQPVVIPDEQEIMGRLLGVYRQLAAAA